MRSPLELRSIETDEVLEMMLRGAVCVMCAVIGAPAQQLTATDHAKLDAAVEKAFQESGVPSVSVGIYRGNAVVYARALGSARLPRTVAINTGGSGRDMNLAATTEKAVPATPAMAYPVGSISKQFTAVCVLLLQERGVLKLDDAVAKWFPEFTRAKDVTLRNLLTHTSGYSDYAPQDYTIPAWTKPVNNYALVKEWATKPLDFDPGTKWQYSNTNFQMAALIIAKASGMSFHDFLWTNVITPLKLEGVLDLDIDQARLFARGYERHAAGPMRPAILEAPGWYSGDGQLAMPVATLLAWDASILHRTLLKPESYDAMETDFKLKDGSDSHYGLGVFVRTFDGKRVVYHSGEVGGFVSNNVLVLDDNIAYAALTNFEGPGASAVTNAIRLVVSPENAPTAPAAVATTVNAPAEKEPVFSAKPAEQATAILSAMAAGRIDRALFTPDANYYFNAETLDDFRMSVHDRGKPQSVKQTSEALRGGMVFRAFDVVYPGKTFSLTTYTTADGKLEQFLLNPL